MSDVVLIVGLTALATVALVLTFGVLFGKRQATLERQLAGYEKADGIANTPVGPETAIVQRGVDFASGVAERTGVLEKVDRALEQADLPLRGAELVFYVPLFAILVFLLIAVLVGPIAGLIGTLAAFGVPYLYVSNRQRNRQKAFERQLPDTLTLLASSLRAGFSLMQGLETVAQEIGPPMRRELQRVFTEVRLGRGIEDALGDAAERLGSRDLAWSVMAIKIQREVGGNLATLLDTVADTMQKRERIRREIAVLTAEGKATAVILSLMPPLAALALYVWQPEYIKSLNDEPIGVIALILAGVLSIIGWFWLRRIIDIEV
jgi:tight adherence protein B